MKWLISIWGDPSGWKEVEYHYKGKSIKSANHLGLVQSVENPNKTLIMVGDSLAYPSVVGKENITYKKLKEKLKKHIKEQFLKKFLLESAELVVLPGGKGTYKRRIGSNTWEYLTIDGESKDLKFIALWYLIQLLEENLNKLFEKGRLEVIFDASHGWNFVPITVYQTLWLVLEILSFFGVDVTFKMIATEPFIDGNTPLNVVEIEERRVPFNLYGFKTREGYKSALRPTEYGRKTGKLLGTLLGELKRFINYEYKGAVVNDIPLIVGAFYNGLPLAVKTFYTPTEQIKPLIDKLFEIYTKGIEISFDIKRALSFSLYTEILFISYLYNLLTEAVGNSDFLRKEETSIKELRKFACKLFGKDEKKLIAITKELGDCEGKTKGEIVLVIEKALKEKKDLSNWVRLKELTTNETEEKEGNANIKKGEARKESIAERNFLAHAGLSRAEIEIKCAGNDIFIRYKPDRLDEIKNWVQNGLTEME